MPGRTPYPDIADVSHATAGAAAFFRSFFTAKTSRDVEATHAHFHPGKTSYFDSILGRRAISTRPWAGRSPPTPT
jgi:hypothetical protein